MRFPYESFFRLADLSPDQKLTDIFSGFYGQRPFIWYTDVQHQTYLEKDILFTKKDPFKKGLPAVHNFDAYIYLKLHWSATELG